MLLYEILKGSELTQLRIGMNFALKPLKMRAIFTSHFLDRTVGEEAREVNVPVEEILGTVKKAVAKHGDTLREMRDKEPIRWPSGQKPTISDHSNNLNIAFTIENNLFHLLTILTKDPSTYYTKGMVLKV